MSLKRGGPEHRHDRNQDEIVPQIRFEFDGISKTVAVRAAPGLQPTLLAIARDNQVPLLSNCEAGACGACIVEIETTTGSTAEMSDAEAFFLRAIGKLEAGSGAEARLACQYRPSAEEDVCVRFASALCSF
ncbi:MAG: 2Fe-2S iron-sulfur cluster-binding protein [Rhodospirillales bacterium]